MERITSLVLLLLFIPRSVREVLLLTYWWQVKEYRYDRLWVFLKAKEGRNALVPPLSWVKFFLLLSFPLVLFTKGYLFLFVFLVGTAFLIENFFFARELAERSARKPVFTLRVKRLIGTAAIFTLVVLLGGYLIDPFLNTFAWATFLLVVDKLIPFTIPAGVAWTQVSVNRAKEHEINQARKRLGRAENLVALGITGSYGKTSTKEFLATILAEKFKTAKTTGSENTEFGIARKIIKNVKKNTEVFVAEMGAYKKGEVARLADIVSPKIGIITGISPQHLALFGSLKNLMEAKYELINSLPDDGVAIFNGNNSYCLKLAKKERAQKTIIYQLGKPGRLGEDVLWADRVRVLQKSISFRVHWKDKVAQFKVNLLGEQFVENILGASAAALVLGMSLDKISDAVKYINPVSRTMEPKRTKKGYLAIDDSYSTNPDGFDATLSYIGKVKFRKKFVVTPGIIELGNESIKIHKRLGQRLAKVADLVILTSMDFAEELKDGMGRRAEGKLVVEKDANIAYQLLSDNIDKDDVVLIEGRIPESLRQKLIR